MNVTLNGAPAVLEDGATVRDVVRRLVAAERGVAVAVDRQVIPRSEWDHHALRDGADIEVLTAAAGG